MVPPEGFTAPGVEEFFFEPLLLGGTPFEITRIILLIWLGVGVLCLFFWRAFRNMQMVPRGAQNMGEMAVGAVKSQVIDEVLGEQGQKFTPYLVALFFFIFIGNIFEIIPFISFPWTSKIAIPFLLAVISYCVFNYVGISRNGFGAYMKMNLVPPGVPKLILILVTPIEFISTFILRPLTLTIRLMANMLAGHLILALFFTATTYLLWGPFAEDGAWWTPVFAVGSFAASVVFVGFEGLVGLLQAYIFTLLTAVYIAGALETEH